MQNGRGNSGVHDHCAPFVEFQLMKTAVDDLAIQFHQVVCSL